MQDLINCTPTSHADYDPLQKTLIITQQFLENLDDESSDVQLSVKTSSPHTIKARFLYAIQLVSWLASWFAIS